MSCNQVKDEKPLEIIKLNQEKLIVPNILVEKEEVTYDKYTSIYYLNNQPFSGFMISFHENDILKEKIGVFEGKKQSSSSYWFSDETLKEVSNYHQGKLNGEKKLWVQKPNYVLVAELNYENGKAHGEQRQWYQTGELYKRLNLYKGKEEGIQQAFRKNGDLYANYEAKNGRIFGMRKAALCYGLEEENIKDKTVDLD